MTPPVIMAYISAHGFGHWAQVAPVLQQLKKLRPELRLILRTALPDTLLHAWLGSEFTHLPAEVDIGVIQQDALHEDLALTRQAVLAFHRDWTARATDEASLLRRHGVTLVLSDIAPIAFAAAQKAGIPGIGLCSIDWHDIYAPLFGADFPPLREIAAAHAACTLLLQPPLCMPMQSFPRRAPIGLIARKSGLDRNTARQAIGLAPEARIALIAFGGMAMPPFDLEGVAAVEGWHFLLPDERRPDVPLPANIDAVSPRDHMLPEMLAAADCVICKPGYGMLAEAWAAGRPIAWVPRPAFPEYPFLRQWLEQAAPALCLETAAFQRGDWQPTLDALLATSKPYPPLPGDGAVEAAERIATLLP